MQVTPGATYDATSVARKYATIHMADAAPKVNLATPSPRECREERHSRPESEGTTAWKAVASFCDWKSRFRLKPALSSPLKQA